MQCDYCDSKATVYFTQIVEGVSKKASLCEKCATAQGVTDPESFLLGNVTLPVASGKKPINNIPAADFMRKEGNCPSCDFAFDDLKKTGRLGCSECYQFFKEEISQSLPTMHKDVSHKGRIPEGMMEDIQLRKNLEDIKKKLTKAVKEEDYEAAALFRDQLNRLADSAKKSETPSTK